MSGTQRLNCHGGGPILSLSDSAEVIPLRIHFPLALTGKPCQAAPRPRQVPASGGDD
jgi:hypothetical protein